MKNKKKWYKRWWVWVIIILILGGIGQLTGNDSGKTSNSKSDSSSSSVKKESSSTADKKSSSKSFSFKSSKKKTYSVGQTFKVGDMQYKINGISTATQVGPSSLPAKAQDTFLVVDLTIKNLGNKDITVDSSYFKLLDGKKTFKADSEGSMSANQDESGNITNSFFLQKLNPDVEMSGKVVFDVSSSEANSQTNKIQVQTGAFGTQTGTVKLH
ncbi:DUF4352 domain-containing protein [Paucilactobacillus sp. N302-9]